jgi:competence ComEA-like helix-hairpin-helix protein
MILTPEERRAVLALAMLLVFGQAVAWWERHQAEEPDRELSAWLTRLASLRGAEDSAAVGHASADAGAWGQAAGDTAASTSGAAPRDAASGPLAPAAPAGGRPGSSRRPGAEPETVTVRSRSEIPPGILESGKLRINEATAEQLEALPGVGPALARRIVAARDERPFTSADDLLRVPGIGPRTLERMRAQIEITP